MLTHGTLGYILFCFVLGKHIAGTYLMGINIGILIYDAIHMYAHFSGQRKTFAWLDRLRDQHMRHHYRHKNREFGVTNGFWDYVFDTAND